MVVNKYTMKNGSKKLMPVTRKHPCPGCGFRKVDECDGQAVYDPAKCKVRKQVK